MHTKRSGLIILTGIVAAAMSVGCQSASTTSTVSGTLKQESFPSAVQKITIHSDKGNTSAPVDAAGRFKVVLEQGHEYSFLLSEDGTGTPIVLRASQARLDTTVRVRSGGALVDLGTITYWAGAQRSTQSIVAAPAVSTKQAPVVCQEEDDEEDGDNNECADGIDPNGQFCDGGPAANQDDGAENDSAIEETDAQSGDKMALPQYNLPAEIGCGDDDDEDSDEDDD